MADIQGKTLSVEQRFEEACNAHGVTPDDVRRMGQTSDGREILHGIAKEAGVTTAEHNASLPACMPDVSPLRAALRTAILATAGAMAGMVTVALKLLAKDGQLNWTSVKQIAPKATAIGAGLGGLVGVAEVMITNNHSRHLRQAASTQWEQQDAAWVKKEAVRQASSERSSVKL